MATNATNTLKYLANVRTQCMIIFMYSLILRDTEKPVHGDTAGLLEGSMTSSMHQLYHLGWFSYDLVL